MHKQLYISEHANGHAQRAHTVPILSFMRVLDFVQVYFISINSEH